MLTRIQLSFLAALIIAVVPATAAQAAHVNWSEDEELALQKANQSGQLVLMKFTADWCGYCRKMEKETFTRPAVADIVNRNFVPVLVDADKHKQLVEHLQIEGLPAILVVSPQMVILERIKGYQTEEKLMPTLTAVSARYSRSQAAPPAIANNSPTATAKAPTRPVSQPTTPAPQFMQTSPQAASSSDAPVQAPPFAEQNPFASTSTTAASVTQQPAARVVPAFGGMCLPAVRENRQLVQGSPQLAMTYHGRTLYFSSREHAEKFRSAPEKYWPQNDGVCPVAAVDQNRSAEGQLQYAAMFRGKLWFMESAESMQKFITAPATYADAVQK